MNLYEKVKMVIKRVIAIPIILKYRDEYANEALK